MIRFRPNRPIARAFTLVELLVVIGVIGVLIAILLPALLRARQAALRTTCASNLRQTGMAMVMYFNEHRGHLPLRPIVQNYEPHIIANTNYAVSNQFADLLLRYTRTKNVWYCPDNYQQRTAAQWWPNPGGAVIAATYQYLHWLHPGNWVIAKPDYKRLRSDLVLGGDYLATLDISGTQLRVWNHGERDGVKGMNLLYCDGRVQWVGRDAGMTRLALAGTIYWFIFGPVVEP